MSSTWLLSLALIACGVILGGDAWEKERAGGDAWEKERAIIDMVGKFVKSLPSE